MELRRKQACIQETRFFILVFSWMHTQHKIPVSLLITQNGITILVMVLMYVLKTKFIYFFFILKYG